MEKEDIKVFLGSKYDNIIQKVAETYIPKDYVDITKNLDALITHDIAIIKLKNPFPKVKKFLEIGGKPEDFEDEKAIECTCIGFGAINKFGHMDFKGRIMTTNVTHGEEACEKHSSATKTNWKQYLCSTPGRLTMLCQGDSGGPMICNGKLYGVCSFFLNYKDLGRNICGGPDMQSVHTFIHFHLKWIVDSGYHLQHSYRYMYSVPLDYGSQATVAMLVEVL
ncbi:chymotrypsin-1-like [Metopolophium dirhodum]|uniref:chymotrypsin-1-like n=1 Tax=Metopolophium dirhodum TaxID=44670 RepID=UPI00298FD922|nr:chymotrypsin-1-like [Metopolophium dirhodum]